MPDRTFNLQPFPPFAAGGGFVPATPATPQVDISVVEDPGALRKFNGTPANTAAGNRQAFRDLFAAGVDRAVLAPGSFNIDVIPGGETVRLHWNAGNQPSILIPEGFQYWDGRGSTLIHTAASRGIWSIPYASWDYEDQHCSFAATDIAAGDTAIPLEAGQGAFWQVGDTGKYMLGSLAYDFPETLNWGFFKVLAVTGDTITLDRPMPQSFSLATVAAQSYADKVDSLTMRNKAFWKMRLLDGAVFENQNVDGNGFNVETGLRVRDGRNITVRNWNVIRCGIGVTLQFVEGGLIDRVSVEDNKDFGGGVAKGFSLIETRGVTLLSPRTKGVKQAVHLEAGARASVLGGQFENTGDPVTNLPYDAGEAEIFTAVSNSHISVHDFTITGYGGYNLFVVKNGTGDASTDGDVTCTGTGVMIHPSEPNSFLLDKMDCVLSYNVADVKEIWDFPEARWVKRRISLRNGMSANHYFPKGVVKALRVYASTGLTFGSGNKLTGLYVARVSGSTSADRTPNLLAGQTVRLPALHGGTLGGSLWQYRNENLRLWVLTGSGTDLDAAGEYLDIEALIVPNRLNPGSTWVSQDHEFDTFGAGETREARFATYDLASIAAGSAAQVDFTITGMTETDHILSVEFATTLAGISIRSQEAIANKCRVIFENQTGAPVDLAATDVRILWRRPR